MSLTLPAKYPSDAEPIQGHFVTLEKFRPEHVTSMWKHLELTKDDRLYYYLPLAVPRSEDELLQSVERFSAHGFVLFSIRANSEYVNHRSGAGGSPPEARNDIVGMIGYLGINAGNRELEVGAVIFAPVLQRSAAATEVHYLVLRHVFEQDEAVVSREEYLPYRRVCWKCDHDNRKSRRAAERLGYVFEGTFRKHMLVKGRNRDSDWLSIVDDEWPAVKQAFEKWLQAGNFDEDGRQIKTLESFR